jgi:hypothetical protein
MTHSQSAGVAGSADGSLEGLLPAKGEPGKPPLRHRFLVQRPLADETAAASAVERRPWARQGPALHAAPATAADRPLV